jgi:hypothetical protein
MSTERFKGYLRILKRIALVIVIITIADAIGLGVILYAQGRLEYFGFMKWLIVLLLLEGCAIGGAGGLMYIGFGTIWGTRRESRDPAPTQAGLKNTKDNRASQQQWTVTMVAVGLLMILIAFLTSSIAQI